ncbi:MAG: Trk system potassium transporter TrkA [Lachnospiraceae bacterium]|nr:Trk system potassium transporter TrkA [Lachnospiraceae bacterium]
MQIIIVGCGNVGGSIARQLSKEGHNLTVIDTNERAVKELSDDIDVMGIVGGGTQLTVLNQAGVATADLLIAVTDSDERNLVCCLIAKKAGTKNTIARVRAPEYFDEIELIKSDLGLSLHVNPELNAAEEIARLLKFPTAMEIDSFANGRVDLMKFEVTQGSPLCGIELKNIPKELKCDILVCFVERGTETLIPTGDFKIAPGDKIGVVASGKKSARFLKAVDLNKGRVKNCMIIGGGELTFYLADMLSSTGVDVKIIENNKKRCDELAELLPEATIIYGDGADKSLLSEEGIERTEAFLALTNHDEENVMMAMYAGKMNPGAKLITKVHRSAYDDIIYDMNIGSIINPKLITSENVVKYVRAMSNSTSSNMEALYQLNSGKAEAMEFTVTDSSELIGVPLMNLKDRLKPNVLVACIIHNGQIDTPKGSSVIRMGDRVILVTTETGFEDLSDILR